MLGERWLQTAYSYLYIRDFAKATDSFRRAIDAEPMNPSYYFHASVTALRNGNLELAQNWAKAAVTLEPTHSLYLEHYAIVESTILTRQALEAELLGNREVAAQLFREALQRDPLNVEAEAGYTRLCDVPAEWWRESMIEPNQV